MTRPHPSEIIHAIALQTGISVAQITSPGRSVPVVMARDMAALALRRQLAMSLPEIAKALGWKSHSTAHAAVTRASLQDAIRERVRPTPADTLATSTDAGEAKDVANLPTLEDLSPLERFMVELRKRKLAEEREYLTRTGRVNAHCG